MASKWNEDDRAPIKGMRRTYSSESFDSFDLKKMLKSLIDEERENLYVQDTNTNKKRMRRVSSSESIGSCVYCSSEHSEYSDDYEYESGDYNDTTTTTTSVEPLSQNANESTEDTTQTSEHLTKIIEDQVYKKFGYV